MLLKRNMEANTFDFCDFDDINLGTEYYIDLGARPKTGKRTKLRSSTSSDASSMMPLPHPSSEPRVQELQTFP